MKNRKKYRLRNGILELLTISFLLIWIYPFITIVQNSFKTTRGMMKNFLSIPEKINFDNYVYAFEKMEFFTSVGNTLFLTVFGVLGVILFSSMAAYKLARTHTVYSNVIFAVCLIPMMVPAQTIMITLTKFASQMHLTGSLLGLCIIYWGIHSPFSTFLFHGFVKGIPAELDESARMDGASSLCVFFQIILPLMKPVIFTSTVLTVISIWNDFLIPLLLLSFDSSKRTITLAIYTAFGTSNIDWPLAISGIVMSIIIPLTVFVMLQRYIVEGVAAGAVKS